MRQHVNMLTKNTILARPMCGLPSLNGSKSKDEQTVCTQTDEKQRVELW